mgnify:CR=1 FL=1
MICKQLYDLAMLAHKPLNPEEMTAFVQRSNEIMMLLTNRFGFVEGNLRQRKKANRGQRSSYKTDSEDGNREF